MRDIIIYGAGGFGKETALMIKQINERSPEWNIVGFCDDGVRSGTTINGVRVLGGMDALTGRTADISMVIAVADPGARKAIRDKVQNSVMGFPSLIHPSALAGDDARNKIGEGCIMCAGSILTTDILLNSFVIVNLSCTIGHDVSVGSYSSIMPCCSVSGAVRVGTGVLLGTGAKILPGLSIGDESRVGAGAVVTRDVAPGTTVVGIPARVV